MIRLSMKSYNMTLTVKQQKYQQYHQLKLINFNILQARKYYLLNKGECYNNPSLLILLQEKL